MNEQSFGANIDQVISIERPTDFTSVPVQVKGLRGVINLRTKVTSVIDLKERLQLGQTEITQTTRILVVQVAQFQVGLLVDAATEVLTIDPEAVEEASDFTLGHQEAHLSGVVKRSDSLLILLNLEEILNEKEVDALEEAAL